MRLRTAILLILFTANITYSYSQDGSKHINYRFKGGETGLRTFIAQNISYPFTSQLNNSIGISLSSITISPKGKIEKIEIINSIDEGIDTEVIRILEKTKNKWQKADTFTYSQTFYIPLVFVITNKSDGEEYNNPLKSNPYFVTPTYITVINSGIIGKGPKPDGYYVEMLKQMLETSEYDKALYSVNELIKRNPYNPKLYQLRIFISGKTKNSELMASDIQKVNNFIPGFSLEQLLNKN